jgi:tRNA(fMet)-specific endonuclease VapC
VRFSLDTNAVIALMKGHPAVIARIRQHGVDTCGLSAIVLHELDFGARRSQRMAENLARVEALPFSALDFNRDDAIAAGQVRLCLEKLGTTIGVFDLLIAAQALARDLTLVTHNVSEFQRIPGLRTADWQ